ncbi:MAG: hypothetical protein NTY06_00690 [Candidatus Gottesmanbacteria bacterium]|nr:hypothetical protein [Candidatus Gottesmanbacteria bacterium]
MTYDNNLKNQAIRLRKAGKTYQEIQLQVKTTIPKSTLSSWTRTLKLPKSYYERVDQLNVNNLSKARKIAVEQNRIKRSKFFNQLERKNRPIARKVTSHYVAKIALAMLCLGEASKYSAHSKSFALGSSDPRIIQLFLSLLRHCYPLFAIQKVRCTVQCRADQDTKKLEKFWQKTTSIPKSLFYKTRIDPRTIGKPTLKTDYKGVLRVDYLDSMPHHDLESLADLVYNQTIQWARRTPVI